MCQGHCKKAVPGSLGEVYTTVAPKVETLLEEAKMQPLTMPPEEVKLFVVALYEQGFLSTPPEPEGGEAGTQMKLQEEEEEEEKHPQANTTTHKHATNCNGRHGQNTKQIRSNPKESRCNGSHLGQSIRHPLKPTESLCNGGQHGPIKH